MLPRVMPSYTVCFRSHTVHATLQALQIHEDMYRQDSFHVQRLWWMPTFMVRGPDACRNCAFFSQKTSLAPIQLLACGFPISLSLQPLAEPPCTNSTCSNVILQP